MEPRMEPRMELRMELRLVLRLEQDLPEPGHQTEWLEMLRTEELRAAAHPLAAASTHTQTHPHTYTPSRGRSCITDDHRSTRCCCRSLWVTVCGSLWVTVDHCRSL